MIMIKELKNLAKMQPVRQLVLLAMIIVIILAVVQPLMSGQGLHAGLSVKANLGNLKGGFNVEGYENQSEPPVFAMFHVDWCGYCKKTLPGFNQFIEENGKLDKHLKIVKINCDENKDLAKQHGIQSYPTLRLYPKGLNDMSSMVDFSGDRTPTGYESFLQNNGFMVGSD
jgi:thiol-disulfide isomerase/thioredoxin